MRAYFLVFCWLPAAISPSSRFWCREMLGRLGSVGYVPPPTVARLWQQYEGTGVGQQESQMPTFVDTLVAHKFNDSKEPQLNKVAVLSLAGFAALCLFTPRCIRRWCRKQMRYPLSEMFHFHHHHRKALRAASRILAVGLLDFVAL